MHTLIRPRMHVPVPLSLYLCPLRTIAALNPLYTYNVPPGGPVISDRFIQLLYYDVVPTLSPKIIYIVT